MSRFRKSLLEDLVALLRFFHAVIDAADVFVEKFKEKDASTPKHVAQRPFQSPGVPREVARREPRDITQERINYFRANGYWPDSEDDFEAWSSRFDR